MIAGRGRLPLLGPLLSHVGPEPQPLVCGGGVGYAREPTPPLFLWVKQEKLEALLLERLGSGMSALMSKKDWEDIRCAVRE
jgi:hypothetical protein